MEGGGRKGKVIRVKGAQFTKHILKKQGHDRISQTLMMQCAVGQPIPARRRIERIPNDVDKLPATWEIK
eukprot:10616624-Karenia_brevis.AAC.1